MNHTIFEYLYRDASNYKAHGAVLLDGRLNDVEQREIQNHFKSGEHFVAEHLGVPDLRPELWKFSGGCPNEDDHSWHEFSGFRNATPIDLQTLECWGTVEEFSVRALSED